MGKTLDYDSCAKWMSLALWAAQRYAEWQNLSRSVTVGSETLYINRDEAVIVFFNECAVEALRRGFSLRAGDRVYGFRNLLKAIDPTNDELEKAFYRIDRESWLTPPGAKPKPGERKQHA